MSGQNRTAEQKIAGIASGGHGTASRAELLRAGVSGDQIDWRVGIGSLIVEFRGVYRVGHRAPSVEATYMAAVKACGDGALLSGMAAAHLYEVVVGPAPDPHVTTRTERRIDGIATRRSARICRERATRWRGIPVTTLPQVLVDIAPGLAVDDLARACHVAAVRHHIKPQHVDRVLNTRTPGGGKLRAVLHGDAPIILSRLEKQFLKLLRDHDLPLPRTNRPAGSKHVDCRWPDRRLTVELDGYRFHNTRHAFENDHRREREAYARGDHFRRYTYGDVFERPEVVVAELQPLLTWEPGTMSSEPSSAQRIHALWPPS